MMIATGEVLTHKKYGEHFHSLTIVAPRIGEQVEPGQFVNVCCNGDRSFILRRPFSVYRVHKRGGWAATIEIVFDIRGPGTKHLAELRSHSNVELLGPCGRGFQLPSERSHCLLIGGGIGAAPLFFLADELRNEGHRVDVIMGAQSIHRLLNAIDVRRLASVSRITTEDGSMGQQGVVTDVIDDMVERCSSDIVYACGPHPMLAAIAQMCRERALPLQVAVEELMACGYGVCMTCVMPVLSGSSRSGTEEPVYARVCTEGPVFDGARVCWFESEGRVSVEQSELSPGGAPVRSGEDESERVELAPPGN
ncbi:MAG TPA: dihydroorotate dehydrogenase electron transfer subunit [Actinomycetota bacterium]|nr:dihydroorotate dehydrogenase electron transfer subunit [Actinomycetota bacterium]